MAGTFTDLSNQELLQKCREGDEKAFNVLFQRFFRPLYQLSLKYISQAEVAEELVMDLMMWLWENRHKEICPDGNLEAYLFRAIRNSIISYLRKKTLATDTLAPQHEAAIKDPRSADHQLVTAEMETLYREKLNQLSPQRKTVFEMSREQGLTYPEIARKMDLSVNTVKSHMTFCLQHLRQHLTDLMCLLMASAISWWFRL